MYHNSYHIARAKCSYGTGGVDLKAIHSALAQAPDSAVAIISVALMLMGGFLASRITKLLKLPNVTAYILAGVVIGPFCLDLVPQSFVDGSEFLADIALAFIAFGTGEFFKLSMLRQNGLKVVVITVAESCVACAAVFCVMYFVLDLSLAFSAVLGALAAATAPASTLMTIRQTGARGDFVNTLLQVVALDDLVGLLAYSVAVSLAVASAAGSAINVSDMAVPLAQNLGIMLLGGVFGLIMRMMIQKRRSTDNRLIISVALIFGFCGFCSFFSISPLLGCMSMGTVYANIARDDDLFRQLNYFSPPILLLFFVRSGISFDLGSLVSVTGEIGAVPLLTVGFVYFIIRIAGKYAGAFIGCLSVKKSPKVRNLLGLALIPQAGVAIGLASLGARTLQGAEGQALQTIILTSSILYELIGPACAKLSLYLSGSYSKKLEDITQVDELDSNGEKKKPVDILIERIKKIQEQLPPHPVDADEQAFTQAAWEQYQLFGRARQRRFNGRL